MSNRSIRATAGATSPTRLSLPAKTSAMSYAKNTRMAQTSLLANSAMTATQPCDPQFKRRTTSHTRTPSSTKLFCTNLDEGYHSHLYIFYADELLGPWRPHSKNPVKIDVRSAGPAGPFFWYEGALYRPTQDCSRLYGGCINITRIFYRFCKGAAFAPGLLRRVAPQYSQAAAVAWQALRASSTPRSPRPHPARGPLPSL